GQVMVVAPR
nr:Chain C, Ribonuclease H2 subunit B [Homo sapiens]